MSERTTSSKSMRAAISAIGLLIFSCAPAQPQQAGNIKPEVQLTHAVPLIPGACPTVNAGESISLDWNPDFDPFGAVVGLRGISLRFQTVAEDSISTTSLLNSMLLRTSEERISTSGNGYFHITVPIPPQTIPGVYHLVDAHAIPRLSQEYQGQAPQMTVSPVRELYCITIVRRSATTSSSSH